MNTKEIPGGIILISAFNIIIGIVMMIVAFNVEQGPLLFISGLVSVIIAFGLLSLKSWGRCLAIIGYAGNIVMCACEENFIGMAVALLIISYLFNDKVKDAFAKKSREAVLT